jgi:hypothetical protein
MGRITMAAMAEELAAQRAEMAGLRAEIHGLRARLAGDGVAEASLVTDEGPVPMASSVGTTPGAPVSRRGVMLAAVGAAAGLAAASVRPAPAAAATGGAFILGQSNSASTPTSLSASTGFGLVVSSAASGQAITGQASATSGVNVGVGGVSQSASGIGVQGLANSDRGLNYGVYAQTNSSAGYALYAKGRMKVTGRSFLATPSGAPPAADMGSRSISFYLDQSANRLRVKVKYSTGAVKYGSIALG